MLYSGNKRGIFNHEWQICKLFIPQYKTALIYHSSQLSTTNFCRASSSAVASPDASILWSTPRIAVSGQPGFSEHAYSIHLVFSANQICQIQMGVWGLWMEVAIPSAGLKEEQLGDKNVSSPNLRNLVGRGIIESIKTHLFIQGITKSQEGKQYYWYIIFAPSLRHTPVSHQHFHFSTHPWPPASLPLFPIPASKKKN